LYRYAPGGAFQALGRSAGDDRSREISRHRAALAAAHDRVRSSLGAEAREMLRFDFGGATALPALPPGAVADGGAAGGVLTTGGGATAATAASGTGAAWWGVRPVPRGAHRVPEEWSQPRVRLQRASVAAAAFLRALQRAGTAGAASHVHGGGLLYSC
jgi:hypothetical protein